jgi:hypothetical protein
MLKTCALGTLLSLLLCSCATKNSSPPQLAADVTMNKGAGRGDELLVTLRLENGKELLCIVDTGASCVLFDQSLEPQLGTCYWTSHIPEHYGNKTIKWYKSPKLYIGSDQLQTGNWIGTCDLTQVSTVMQRMTFTNRPIMAILGLSCLKHYCIQFDFTAGKMRFLDGDRSNKADWGMKFPLITHLFVPDSFYIRENLVGVQGPDSLIDSGANFDGWLTPKLFQQWTNHVKSFATNEVHFPNGVLGGEHYSDIELNGNGKDNGIGLRFLARHFVTFDFPNQTMYLKRTSIGPLVDEDTAAAVKFLKDLKKNGQQPGWSKDEKGQIDVDAYPITKTLSVQKNGNPTIYLYTIARTSKDGPLTLQRAWRMDQNCRTIEEFPISAK